MRLEDGEVKEVLQSCQKKARSQSSSRNKWNDYWSPPRLRIVRLYCQKFRYVWTLDIGAASIIYALTGLSLPMSLAIFVKYTVSLTGETKIECWPAGNEDFRRTLWAAPELKSLGLRILPQIENDLLLKSDEFDALLQECDTLLAACNSATDGVSTTVADAAFWEGFRDRIPIYVNNFRKAVALARSKGSNELEVS